MRGPVLVAGTHRLSPFAEDDLPALARWLAQERVARGFADHALAPAPDAMRRWVAACDGRRALLLAIREGERAAGFWHVRPTRGQRRAELSVVLGERAGRGAVVATGIALFDWLFAQRSIEKLTAGVLASNRPALRLADAWMAREGFLRGEVRLPGGGRGDVVRYGLLADDWRRRRCGNQQG